VALISTETSSEVILELLGSDEDLSDLKEKLQTRHPEVKKKKRHPWVFMTAKKRSYSFNPGTLNKGA